MVSTGIDGPNRTASGRPTPALLIPMMDLNAWLLVLVGALLLGCSSSTDAPPTAPPADLSPIAAALDTVEAPDDTAVPDGALLISGGATLNRYAEFVDLAGGADATIVYVPTALAVVNVEEQERTARTLTERVGGSPENVTVLHTRDPNVADLTSFVAPLAAADAVWFVGGRQWRLVKAYAGTATLDGFRSVLDRGGVIGGGSAGATIQGSFLVRGDPASNEIMVGTYRQGFGFLPQSAIDQHLLTRNRRYDLIPVIEANPSLLGIGIAENTSLVVYGDTARVTGAGIVALYDHRRWSQADSTLSRDEKLLVLQPGDRFDLRTRRTLPPTD